MAKRKIKRVRKKKKPEVILPIVVDDTITKSFFYDIASLQPLKDVSTKDNMLVIQNKGHEVAIEVNHDRNKIKLYSFEHQTKNMDISVEITIQQLIKFIKDNKKIKELQHGKN